MSFCHLFGDQILQTLLQCTSMLKSLEYYNFLRKFTLQFTLFIMFIKIYYLLHDLPYYAMICYYFLRYDLLWQPILQPTPPPLALSL